MIQRRFEERCAEAYALGKIAVAYGAPPTLTLNAGMEAAIPVRVLNSGSEAWDLSVTLAPGEGTDDPASGYHTSRFPAVLTGTWVSTTAAPVPAATPIPPPVKAR